MKLIVGLGNPGPEYQDTRHNAGRVLVESLAKILRVSFSKDKKLKSSWVRCDWNGVSCILSYPEIFMNMSGETVQKLAEHFAVDVRTDLMIVVDDFALPFGKLRLRSRGSDGGHNGLKSVTASLGSQDYPRLRLGVAPADYSGEQSPVIDEPLEGYVLSPFLAAEKKELPAFYERGREALKLWLTEPMDQAMSAVNAFK